MYVYLLRLFFDERAVILLPRIIRAESLCCRLKRVEDESKCYICENRFCYSLWKQAPRPWKFDLVRGIIVTGRDVSIGLYFLIKKPQTFTFQTFISVIVCLSSFHWHLWDFVGSVVCMTNIVNTRIMFLRVVSLM